MSARVIISGGGTGGHIFPALAIANAIKKERPDTEILFVGANGRMEMEKVPAAGYKIEGLNISGIQRKLTVENISWPFKLISSLKKAGHIIDAFKPDVAVGVGGYASGPLLYMASRKKIPTLIQEQNSYPGITNKILAGRANVICVAYENMERFFPREKILLLGNPVRETILNTEHLINEARQFFGLDTSRKTILIVGGSLGARTINLSIQSGLPQIVNQGIQVIWQTGKWFYKEALQTAEPYKGQVKVFDFISRMDLAYSISNLVISRAGASTVSELCIVKKPSILVPSPNVAEDHQTKNAMALVKKQAAILVADSRAKDDLVNKAIEIISDNQIMQMLGENIFKLALKDSAHKIANEVFKLIPQN